MIGTIALLGDYSPENPRHVATHAAIEHSCRHINACCEASWVATDAIDQSLFKRYSAIWVAPGSPYKNMEKALWAIRYAREQGVPCFGTCGGFQHMIIEYGRNVLGFVDAQHAEYDPYASNLFISRLECALAGREMTLRFAPDSRTAEIYGMPTAKEEYYCNFGVNPDRVGLLKNSSLKVAGSDQEGEIRIIELPDHPFFIGTLFVPQTRSAEDRPHPLVTAFVKAAAGREGSVGRDPRADWGHSVA